MYTPKFTITTSIAQALMRIEAHKQAISDLPITPDVLLHLRETARLATTHYSTAIEGNDLEEVEVKKVIQGSSNIQGKERDTAEVKGYYAALQRVERLAGKKYPTEKDIQTIHALVIGGGRNQVKPTLYRTEQNVIKDSRSGTIVYLPPEEKDVPQLMEDLVLWIKSSLYEQIPLPLRAGIAHYQYVTIHPYLDGNGRTARLLTTLIAHQGGYDLKGIFSVEEYYVQSLQQYYDALSLGLSHNYYFGRHEADITPWLEYFCAGMAESFDKIHRQAQKAAKAGQQDFSPILRDLDPRQRKVLSLFVHSTRITTREIATCLNISTRAASAWCQKWVNDGFLRIMNPAKRNRSYALGKQYESLVVYS